MQEHFTISELAHEFDITLRTLRFYEEQGLIEPERKGRSRLFSKRDRARIKLILRGRRIGLSLTDIREIIALYDQREEASQAAKLLDLLLERRRQLEAQRQDLDAILAEIDTLEAHCRSVSTRPD
ncbi:MerR family DNA-binding transcriptional regulator [Craterilacuibacter sp. RT1T]|uniref:MerR family transcriptional regulator n=1 Tax=Craterilacuibacter sp. RT1T TaxID=2942211 RepID=UPI0020BD8076|nr:MerR family DNA-binding transcriptional regulator [Craterilacuibacter sp. RT1T]MCL6262663.1 MerR family DNA-binding transcriptional regulator [Craterilacuibacter sp. RT1T]